MKYVCLGYIDDKMWEKTSESDRNGFMDACFAYDEELRKNGHFFGGEALQSASNAIISGPKTATRPSPMVHSPRPRNRSAES